ncbi:MAG: adenylate/guanylate cyclase domain-containing protein [bacterium]|nr:adenylate/guanylate cyclase domain-containing protein [bacterium]
MSTTIAAPTEPGITPGNTSAAGRTFSKAEFLEKFPWDPEWAQFGSPVDDLWIFEYDYSVEQVWPVIADTSTLNHRLELPPMTFEERDGKLYGSATYAGIYSEWEEIPWQWEHLRSLESARLYSRGIARYVRGIFYLEALPGNRCRYYVYFGWVPTGPLTRLMLRIGLKRLREKYGKAIEAILQESHAKENDASGNPSGAVPPAGDSPAASEAGALAAHELLTEAKSEQQPTLNVAKLMSCRKTLLEAEQPEALVDRVLEYVSTATDDVLYRIRVKALARQWKVDERRLLLLFLHGTRAGLFYLTWDVICPHCRGVRSEVTHLGELPQNDECDVCEIDFDTQGINSFEVTFHVHRSVREVEKQFFCSAEPAKKDHIKLQLSLKPGESRDVQSLLASGVYRMRVQGERVYHPLELDASYERSPVDWRSEISRESVVKAAPRPPVLLANPAAEQGPRTFIIEENVEDRDMLRPVDLFNFQDFRDLFSKEALAADIQLDVGLQTILFTDIVGSSRYYQDRGDQGAFAQVRKHFVELYRIVKAHNGAVVKTIGDAAMAAFSRPIDAIFAAVEMQEYYSPENDATDLRLRISVHQGPCLAVNLNSNIDYFGNTVNLAAKLQALAESGQIAFSGAMLEDRETRRHFSQNKIPLARVQYTQPWDGSSIEVYRFSAHSSKA